MQLHFKGLKTLALYKTITYLLTYFGTVDETMLVSVPYTRVSGVGSCMNRFTI